MENPEQREATAELSSNEFIGTHVQLDGLVVIQVRIEESMKIVEPRERDSVAVTTGFSLQQPLQLLHVQPTHLADPQDDLDDGHP